MKDTVEEHAVMAFMLPFIMATPATCSAVRAAQPKTRLRSQCVTKERRKKAATP